MMINAYNKFRGAIVNGFVDFNFTKYEITDREVVAKKLEKGTGKARLSLAFIETKGVITEVKAYELVADNGLLYLDSEITYCDKLDNIHNLKQLILTTDYNNEPLVNIILSTKQKGYKQLLVNHDTRDFIFSSENKDVEITITKININGRCGSVFTTYTDLHTNELIKEEYKQGYALSKDYGRTDALFRLCGCFSRKLEILYDKDKPIYAQLSEKYNVEMAGYDSHLLSDVRQIVNIVNEEVDLIVNEIYSVIDKHKKEDRVVQKRIGTK